MLKQSPILQAKYRWQEKEYRRTKNMKMEDYVRFVKKEVKKALASFGYARREVTPGVFRVIRAP